MPDLTAAEEYRKAQDAEWSAYTASEDIFIDGIRAFNAGDPVPVGHVTRKVVLKSQVTPTKQKDA